MGVTIRRTRLRWPPPATDDLEDAARCPAPPTVPTPTSRRAAPRSRAGDPRRRRATARDRKSTRLNSSHANISYAVFCLKKKNQAADDFDYGNAQHHSTRD